MADESIQSPAAIRAKWDNIPDWDKIVYLYRWCESLEESAQKQQQEILLLQERLLRVESS
jgi:hypothetical protein